jgi:hypothetical protein
VNVRDGFPFLLQDLCVHKTNEWMRENYKFSYMEASQTFEKNSGERGARQPSVIHAAECHQACGLLASRGWRPGQ